MNFGNHSRFHWELAQENLKDLLKITITLYEKINKLIKARECYATRRIIFGG